MTSHQRVALLLFTLIGFSIAAHAQTNTEVNQSLIKADQTCQRIVLNGTGDAIPSEESILEDILISFEYSFTDIDDSFLGKGATSRNAAVSVSGSLGDWQVFAVAGHERYRWDTGTFKLRGNYIQLAATRSTIGDIQIGPFIEMDSVETRSTTDPDTNQTIWATGLLASRSFQIQDLSVGLSTALASMNKRNVSEIFDERDSAVAVTLDGYYPLSAHFAVTGYAYYYSLLDNPRPTDGHYWLFGAELEYRPNDEWIATIGYSITTGNSDYEAEQLLAMISYQF